MKSISRNIQQGLLGRPRHRLQDHLKNYRKENWLVCVNLFNFFGMSGSSSSEERVVFPVP